jgi:hypothetical protein
MIATPPTARLNVVINATGTYKDAPVASSLHVYVYIDILCIFAA